MRNRKRCEAGRDEGGRRDVFPAQIVYPVYIRLSSGEIRYEGGAAGRRKNNEAGGVAACEVGAGQFGRVGFRKGRLSEIGR